MQGNQPAFNPNSVYDKLSRLTSELQQKGDIGFDVRLTLDMKQALLLDRLEKIAKNLRTDIDGNDKAVYNAALAWMKRVRNQMEFIAFGELRKNVFMTEMAQTFIASGDISKAVDNAIVFTKLLGLDDADANKLEADKKKFEKEVSK